MYSHQKFSISQKLEFREARIPHAKENSGFQKLFQVEGQQVPFSGL